MDGSRDIFAEMGDVWAAGTKSIVINGKISDLYYEPYDDGDDVPLQDIYLDGDMTQEDTIYDIDTAAARKICKWLQKKSLDAPLRITYCDVKTEDLQLIPRYVYRLILTGNAIEVYDTFLYKLVLLNLSLNPLRSIDVLPIGLKELNVAHTLLEKLPRLPMGLERLNISNTRIKSLYGLPQCLKKLVMNECGVRVIKNGVLPNGLEHLECASCELEKIPSTIPDTVRYLNVAWNNIRHVKRWPDALLYLDIRMNPYDGAVPAYVHDIFR